MARLRPELYCRILLLDVFHFWMASRFRLGLSQFGSCLGRSYASRHVKAYGEIS